MAKLNEFLRNDNAAGKLVGAAPNHYRALRQGWVRNCSEGDDGCYLQLF